jgi:HEAT repeat protein
MRVRITLVVTLCLFACAGCAKKKSTDELIQDLKPSGEERDRYIAVRSLTGHKGEAAQIVPALIEALKDKEGDVRQSAAIGLGTYGEQAKDAVPALKVALKDHDARVRNAARMALARISAATTTAKLDSGKESGK